MPPPPDERLTDVESALMLLQRDVETLSESLIDYGRLLDELKRTVEKLTARVDHMETENPADPADERPPHY